MEKVLRLDSPRRCFTWLEGGKVVSWGSMGSMGMRGCERLEVVG